MPRMGGLELLRALADDGGDYTVLILTAQGTVESAVEAIKDGAYDYLTKPIEPQRLKILLDKIVERHDTLREVKVLRKQLRDHGAFGQMIGSGPQMRKVYQIIEQAAPTSASVLIWGESGTGKELVAQTIHQLSPRAHQPFVPINCAAIPETLLESEIFGHEKGAFTGAFDRREGCFELADRGTLFLDEIAEMTPATQVKLLRVLQERKFRRLGGRQEQSVDVRVIAATNADPARGREDGQAARGPVLPPQRVRHRAAAAAEAQGGPAAAGPGVPGRVQRPQPQVGVGARPGRHAAAGAVQLAGQRARAAQRDRARGHPVFRASSSSPSTCRR